MKSALHSIAKPLVLLLSFQLAFGPVFSGIQDANAQVGIATTGATQITTRGLTEGYTLPKEHRTPDGVKIDDGEEAEGYINAVAEHANTWAEQCVTQKGGESHVRWDAAFVLSENIPYADMNVKNCAQEHEKLTHMVQLADQLAEDYGIEEKLYKNVNCADCGIQPGESGVKYFDNNDPDFIHEGEKCSRRAQAVVAAESCGLAKKFGGMLNLSCIGNIIKGVLKGLKEAIVGIGKLLWEGLKWAGKQIKKGWNKLMVWTGFKKAESKADSNAHAVSKEAEASFKEHERDPEGWLKKAGNKVLDFLKEVVYIGLYDRESKCMNCKERSQLLCEITGRIINDVVGFTFTLGFGYGALKTIAGKIGPKLADVTAKMNARFASAVQRGNGYAKTLNATKNIVKKPFKFVGKVVVKTGRMISKGTLAMWKKFRLDRAYKAITQSKRPGWLGKGMNIAKRAANTAIPQNLIVKPAKWMGRGIRRYFNFDQRVFARGAKYGSYSANGFTNYARSVEIMEKMMPKLDKAEVSVRLKGGNDTEIVTHLQDRGWRSPKQANQWGKHGIGVKDRWRTWEMHVDDLDPETAASFKRAGFQSTLNPETKMLSFEAPNLQFKKWYRGEFDTKFDVRLGIPKSKDGNVIIEVDGAVQVRRTKDITQKELKDLNAKNALFRTQEHPETMSLVNPNKLDQTYLSRDLGKGPQGTLAYIEKGESKVQTVSAKHLSPDEMKEMQDRGVKFIEGGTDNPLAKAEYKNGKVVDILEDTEAAQIAKLKETDMEKALAATISDTKQLDVILSNASNQTMTRAQQQLQSKVTNYGINSKTFKGMEEAMPVEASLMSDAKVANKNLAVIEVNGQQKVLEYSGDAGSPIVHVYDDAKKAIVQKADGQTIIYDISGDGEKTVMKGVVDKKHKALVDEAMGATINGKPVKKAQMDSIITNLEMNGKKAGTDFTVTTHADGTRTLEVNLPPGCVKNGKGTVSISQLAI